ncbi:MAG: type II toxin-antitoxin system HipA family toxin [Burkholderiales bacterium]
MQPVDELDVFYGEEPVGTLYDTAPLAFEYSSAWLKRAARMAVAAIPLVAGRNDSAAVQAFFENLLPEGELRQYLAEKNKASTLFALMREVAGDTAGGFVIVPGGQTPRAPTYEATTWEALAGLLGRKSASAIDIKGRGARISLAGAQDKAVIAIFDDGVPRLPRATAPTTHILKPDIKRLSKVWHSAANEAIVMLTAAKCGLPTAQVFYEPHTQACVVRRFDRIARADGSLGRLVQYDLCQLTGTLSQKKYEKEGGPGIAACAEMIRAYSTQPAVDLRAFVSWILFNLFVGNNDSHAKNLAMVEVHGGGVALAPFYDLMCTRLYSGLSQEFAFAVGGEVMPGSITREHLDAMAAELRMRPQFIARLAREMAKAMPTAVGAAVQMVSPALPHGAKALAGRLKNFVLSTTAKLASRIEQ